MTHSLRYKVTGVEMLMAIYLFAKQYRRKNSTNHLKQTKPFEKKYKRIR